MTTGRRNIGEIIKYGMLAGAAGGLTEIAWVSLYASITGGDAAILARGVTTAAGVSALLPAAPVSMGIAVHMVLAGLLGIALAALWQTLGRSHGAASLYVVTVGALAGVWALNFLVVLPLVSPGFVQLLPDGASLTSKLLFGIAAAEVLRRCGFARTLAPARIKA